VIKGYSKNKTILKAYDGDVKMPSTLSLSSDDLKDIKNWKVGGTYDLEMTVKQTSMHQDPDGSYHASFEIQDVSVDDGEDNGDDNN